MKEFLTWFKLEFKREMAGRHRAEDWFMLAALWLCVPLAWVWASGNGTGIFVWSAAACAAAVISWFEGQLNYWVGPANKTNDSST